ncbi:hypothetical protein Q8A67_018047 [Cirrhinus molitorella]|uniref:Uncharacterized protein n=1 Tax=Cirrhinus molitorella TaxID=172907 RepID=A0AA88PGW7_9TELE|nr:hypothetical protein Q8A67_018047 [Cirrhinus molitorella]
MENTSFGAENMTRGTTHNTTMQQEGFTKENYGSGNDQDVFKIVSIYLVCLNSCLNPILYMFMCDEYKKKLKQSLLLVLETAFTEDHLDFKADANRRAGQENQTELLDM